MITTEGALHVKRYLAGIEGAIGRSIALGVGAKAEAADDKFLDFESIRADIISVSYEYSTNKLIFKATFPEDFIGSIYEMGIFSLGTSYLASDYGSRSIALFDVEEGWSGTFSGTNARIGSTALQHTPAASATSTGIMTGSVFDLSGYSGADLFSFAYNIGNANTSQLTFRFLTDAANYYSFSLGAQTAGYKVTRLAKDTATITGTPSWSNITELRVITTSGAGGASDVAIDGIRIEDVDTYTNDHILVARELLATPFVKTQTMPQDVEFSLAVSIT